jgi:tRNA (cmo5U34)-methyltransferase
MASQLNTFNWIAPFYDRLASVVFGSTLFRAQLAFIDSIENGDAVLILGGGSGKFLETLIQRKPLVSVCYIEASEKMLRQAKTRAGTNHSVNFIHGTEDTIPDLKFNVVITNFFLDLFPEKELENVVDKISARLVPGGKWIVTDFEKSSRMEHRFLLWLMYSFFRASRSIRTTKLPDWRIIVGKRNLYTIEDATFKNGFVKSTLLGRKTV